MRIEGKAKAVSEKPEKSKKKNQPIK